MIVVEKWNFTPVKRWTQNIFKQIGKITQPSNDCILCDYSCDCDDKLICDYCFLDIELFPLGYDLLLFNPKASENIKHSNISGITLATDYRWPFDRLLVQLKFHNKQINAKVLGQFLQQQLEHLAWPNFDLICPVPLHRFRLLKRGYNQAELIAKYMQDKNGIYRGLKRNRSTKAQTQLNRKQRRKNIIDAFYCEDDLTGKTILLVDDVVTTGSTVDEAAKTLIDSGATAVYVAAVAIRLMD